MVRGLSIVLLVSFIGASLLWAAPGRRFIEQELLNSRLSRDDFGAVTNPQSVPTLHLDDYVGTIDTAGITYCEAQGGGRMIDVDDSGKVSVVWTGCLTPNGNLRRVYHNVWNPALENFIYDTIGILVDVSQRAGGVTQTTSPDGFCFPAFHQIRMGDNYHAAAAIDYVAYCDAFTTWEPDWCYEGGFDMEIMWPNIDMDMNGNLHMISCENPSESGITQRLYYSRGIPVFDEDGFGLDILWDP